MKRINLAATLFVFVLFFAGCASLDAGHSGDSQTDTTWLIHNLEDEGIAIEGRGSASLDLRTVASTRMVLNNHDVVDIYEFDTTTLALENAQILQGSDARRDVYILNELVVVHYGRAGSGVKSVLNDLLGRTL